MGEAKGVTWSFMDGMFGYVLMTILMFTAVVYRDIVLIY